QHLLQFPQQRPVALVPLHLDRLVQQVAPAQVVEDELEQVDVLDPQPRLLTGDVFEQVGDVFPDPQLVFGRVVEDVEGDLVADAAAAQEVVGDDPGQDFVQAGGQAFTHGATWMHRRTYSSPWLSR